VIVFQEDRIVYVNPAITTISGYTMDDLKSLVPEQINHLFHPADQPMMQQRLQDRRAGKTLPGHYEIRVPHKAGGIRFLEAYTVPIIYGGKPALQTTAIDLTERRQMEQALLESEETIRTIFNATDDSLGLFDVTGVVLAANGILASRLGKTVDEILGSSMYELFPEKVAKQRKIKISEALRTKQAVHFEDFRQGIWFDNHVHPIFDSSGEVTRLVGTARDVTERKRMVESLASARDELEQRVSERTLELLETQDQLRKLTKDVILAQEEERRRVSRELHDEAGQALVIMKYGLEMILTELPSGNLPIRERLESAMHQIDQTMQQIRHLAHSLRPPLFDVADLDLTLQDHCHEIAETTGLKIDYTGVSIPYLSEEAGLSFFRFLQEALTNVIKHAKATHVDVKLSRQAGRLSLSVADNGVGPLDDRTDGRGHIGMRERFMMLNGEVLIEVRGRSGFAITASIPYNPKGMEDEPGE
jgi:PAS domain S-box-containing protein